MLLIRSGSLCPAPPESPAEEGEEEEGEEEEGAVGDGLGGVEALRIEAEGDGMLAGGDDYGAEDVVGTQDVGRFAVDGALPARVVDV